MQPTQNMLMGFWTRKETERIPVAVTLSTCIQEVLGSKLDQDTSYHVWGYLLFSSVAPGKCRDISRLGHERFVANPFNLARHLSSYHSKSYSLAVESVLQKKKVRKKIISCK